MPKYRVHVEYFTEVEADSASEAECMVEDADVPADAEVLDIDAGPMPGESAGFHCPLCDNDVQIGHTCPSDSP